MTKKKPISVAARKAKGRNLQQWVRDIILERNPELDKSDVKSTSMGASGEDVQLSAAARKLVPISVECKARATFVIYSLLKQAVNNSHGVQPVLVVKGDRKKPLVVVDAEHYFTILRRAQK